MHRIAALLAMGFLTLTAFAQQPVIENIEVSVVNVDVTVTDHGKPVRGLTADDFEILEDGVPQKITNFYAIDHPENAANVADDDLRFRRKVLVLVDNFSVTPFERERAFARLEEFINDRFRGGEYDWSIAALEPEARVILPPTSDKQAIHAALDDLRTSVAKSRFAKDRTPGEQLADSQEVADGLIEATRAFAAGEGKKIILLMTAQLLPDDSFWGARFQWYSREVSLTRDRIIQEANASNVNVYIVNPEGVAAGDPSMYWVARKTGGRLMPGNDIRASLRTFETGSGNFYSLGYRAPHDADGLYHRIQVRVKKGRFALQYRDGYSSVPDDVQVDRTLASPFSTSMVQNATIPLSLTIEKEKDVEDGSEMQLTLSLPASQLQLIPDGDAAAGRIDIYLSIYDSTGRRIRFTRFDRSPRLARDQEKTATIVDRIESYFSRGKRYRIVVAVRDEITGAMGITEHTAQF